MSQATTAMPYRTRDPFRFSGIISHLRQLATLLRKELRENLWFALAFILILSIDLLQYALNSSPQASPGDTFGVITILLATFTGVISGLRDLSGHRQDFWRSRPITARAFATTRLTAGLISWVLPVALVFAAYAVTCLYRYVPDVYRDPANYHLSRLLTCNLAQVSFAFAAFAIAHLAATLLRSAVDAALLTLAVLLCLWLLPIVLPPLSFLNTLAAIKYTPLWIYPLTGGVGWREGDAMLTLNSLGIRLLYRPDFALHLLGMLTIAAACGTLACLAISRNWHTPVNRKFTLWSLGASAVLLLASAGLQIRSTLSSTQELTVVSPVTGSPCFITQFLQTDRQLFAIAYTAYDRDPAAPAQSHFSYYAYPLTQSGASWSIGQPIPLGKTSAGYMSGTHVRHAWTPALPDRIYTLDHKYTDARTSSGAWTMATDHLILRETSISPQTAGQVLCETDLLPSTGKNGASMLGIYGSIMLLRPWHDWTMQYDLVSKAPINPKKPATNEGDTYHQLRSFDQARNELGHPREPYTLTLPTLEGFTPAQRLDLLTRYAVSYNQLPVFSAGRLALLDDGGSIRSYRQTELTSTLARFTPTAQYDASTVESHMYGSNHMSAYGASDNWIYRLYWSGGLRLFHLTDSSITLAGQFNRPADRPLAAHIAGPYLLVGGQKLYIVPLPTP